MSLLLVVALAGYLGWPVCYWLGRRAQPAVPDAMAALEAEAPPEGVGSSRFLVVARTNSGSRARQMFENGAAGTGESLEIWDGETCRGRKGPTVSTEA
jgi:hypothetical protein